VVLIEVDRFKIGVGAGGDKLSFEIKHPFRLNRKIYLKFKATLKV